MVKRGTATTTSSIDVGIMASDPRADAHAMLALLAQSMGAQEPLRSQAEKKLEALQQQPLSAAFVAAVCEQIAISPDGNNAAAVPQLDGNVRLLASIWLKHFAKRSWKAARHWSDADRVHLRRVVLAAALQEPHTPIATQLALVVATVARGDFPAQWSLDQLFAPMMQTLQDANASILQQRRCLDVMYRLVKELATRRLLMHRKQFAILSVDLLPVALQHWCTTVCGAESSTENDRLAMLLTSTKLITTLLLNAFRDLAMLQNGEVVRATLERLYEHLDRFVALQQPRAETLDKLCYRMAQLIVGVQKAYPIEFRSYLSPFLSLFWKIILVPVDTQIAAAQPPSPRLQIQALQFIANVVNCKLYQRESLSTDSTSVVAKVITATGDVNLTDAMVLEANAAVLAFLEPNMEKLLQSIVLHYMVLQQSDLDEWQCDPEAFAVLSESLTAEESVRACAENLFLTLLQTYPTQTLPVLTQLTAAATTWLAEGSHALQADAVLLAIGLGCYDLHDCFEFEPWFLQHLVPLLQADTDVPVLQYRVVWLVSCWLAQLSAAVTAPLYDALLQVASRATDAALRLRVVQTLEAMLGDWGFQSQVFAPFLPRALASLYAFFPDTHASESKLAVLGCVEAMLQACDANMIVGVSEQVSAPLPTMWQNGGEAENLVRGKILSLLARLLSCVKTADAAMIAAHGAQLHALHAMCLQVVQFATDVSNPDQVFLMESGLELWLETLTIAPAYGEELHVLFGNAVRLVERDYEHVKLVLTLLEQYVTVGGARFWQDYHTSVGALLASVVGGVKAEASLQLARVVERIVTVFPAEQLGSVADVLRKMVDACAAYSRRLRDDGMSVVTVEPESVVVAYLSVVARLLMQHCVWFAREVLAHEGSGAGVLVTVVVLMLDKFFGVVAASMSLRRRKMWAIALCAVLDLVGDVPTLLESVGQIIESCVDVMDDEREMKRDAGGNGQDGQDVNDDDEDAEAEDAGGAYRAYKSYRKQKLVRQQQAENGEAAVDTLDLREHLHGKLVVVAATVGTDVFAQVMRSVDASALTKLQ